MIDPSSTTILCESEVDLGLVIDYDFNNDFDMTVLQQY